MEMIGKMVLWLGLFVPGLIYDGYVFSILWEWFIVPVFDLPILSVPVAMGISLVIVFCTHRSRDSDKDFWKHIYDLIGSCVIGPTIYLGIGYAIYCFI
jgi:hypothetical protein